MSRRPDGEHALSGAERQARYRQRQNAGAEPAAKPAPPKPPRRSRPERWDAAVGELLTLQAEYVAWLEALPEATRDTPTAEALQAIADLDFDELAAIRPPRGFGRD